MSIPLHAASPLSSDTHHEIERLASSEHADSLAEDLNETKKEKRKRQHLKEKKNKSKPASALSVIEKETSSDDLFKSMLHKMSDKQSLIRSKHRRAKQESELKSSIKSYFEGDSSFTTNDQVTLSRSASAYASPSLLHQNKKQDPRHEKTLTSPTSKERDRGLSQGSGSLVAAGPPGGPRWPPTLSPPNFFLKPAQLF